MAHKIATVSTVFAACDRLDAANERWNREDVRNEVGGGGYVVIDPLIRAWRSLKPLREVAPSTPTELLHQVAVTIENHISDFTEEVETRLSESQQIFEATIADLSEKMTLLEADLAEKNAALEETEASSTLLIEQLDEKKEELSNAQTANAQLVIKNDELSGQVARMEKQHQVQVQTLQTENKDLLKQHAKERAQLSDEHASAIANQRQELTDAAEQAENRLMMLLDQERQDAKTAEKTLSADLEKASRKLQSERESVVALETSVTELTRHNQKLETDLATESGHKAKLQTAVEQQKAATAAIKHEFSAYKQKHELGGELGALQDAVVSLQAKLTERENKEKK